IAKDADVGDLLLAITAAAYWSRRSPGRHRLRTYTFTIACRGFRRPRVRSGLGCFALEDACEHGHVDVSAGEDRRPPTAPKPRFFLDKPSRGRGTRAFRDIVRVDVENAHGVRYLVVGH